MGTIENFIESFYNLEGITIDEKVRSFRKLIHQNITLLQDQERNGSLVEKVAPRTHLESLFKVDLLIACQRTEDLFDILTSGNEVSINKIIKHGWFIHEAFQHKDAQEITDNLLPQLSYSIRMKILKKLSIHLNDEDKLYDLFNNVKNKYGTKAAMPLILGCSEKRLESIIRNNAIFFTSTQLRHFIRRAPKLLHIYVEEYIKHKDNYDFLQDRELIRYIAAINYDVYYDLHKKYNVKIHHGKRTTRKMFEKQKEDILRKPSEYEDIFEISAFIRKLCANSSFKKYFIELFPKKIDSFSYTEYSNMESRLKYFPKSKRFQLLEECFEEMYNVQLYDCPQNINTDILDLISDSNKKQSIVDKIMKLDDDIKYVVYQKTSNSIPILKREMDLASSKIDRRRDLIRGLIKTCKINEELDTLKEVIKYIITRHRNDEKIHVTFMDYLNKNYDPHNFDKDHWELIIQLMELYEVKDGCNMYLFMDSMLTYSEFLFNKTGELGEESLLKSMKYSWANDGVIFSHKCSNLKFIRTAILKAIDLLPKVVRKEDLHDAYCDFATRIISWNHDHRDHTIPIDDHPIFFESLKNQSTRYRQYSDVRALFCTKDRSDKVIELLDFYWNESSTLIQQIGLYYLKWYPTTFLSNMKSSINGFVRLNSSDDKIFKMVKKYEHIELPQNMINCIQENLEVVKGSTDDSDDSDDTEIPINSKTFAALARLMHPEDYISYIAKYKPDKLIIDFAKVDKKHMFKMQRCAVENLKYLPPLNAIPEILEYCGGDFLGLILAALHKISYRTRETELRPLINQLMKNSVSIRKHSTTLAFHLLDLNFIENISKTLLTVERNASLQKRFRLSILKLFQHNPSDKFWNLFKCSLSNICSTNKESFGLLVNIEYLPIEYRSLYFEEIWTLIDNSCLVETQKYSLKNTLCSKMSSNMKNISSQMSLKVIRALFMKFSNMFTYNGSVINIFVCEFLYQNPKPECFVEICNILDIAKTYVHDLVQPVVDVFEEICLFLNNFCDYFVSDNCRKWNVELTKNFMTHLCNLYPPIEYFSEYTLVSLISILLELQEANIKQYAAKVSIFSRKIFDIYGPYVIDILISSVVKSLKFFISRTNDYSNVKIEFIKEILVIDKSEFTYKIMLEVMSTCNCDSCEYKEVLNIIKSCEYPSIQIILRQKCIFTIN